MTRPAEYLARDGDIPPRVIEEIARLISEGEIVILPTDTIYGLHCDARNEQAVEKIFQLKAREKGKPLIVLAANIGQLIDIGLDIDARTESVLDSIWPAPLTAILPLRAPIAASAGAATIAARIPAAQWLRDLVTIAGPVASTSVNVSGRPAIYNMKSVEENIKKKVAAILDIGPLDAKASTVVDFTSNEPHVIREGEFRFTQDLWKTPRKSL